MRMYEKSQFKKINLQLLSQRFAFITTNPELLLSTVLNTRFKRKYFPIEEINRCATILKEQLSLFYEDNRIRTVPQRNQKVSQ